LHLGDGYVQEIPLREHVTLYILDYTLHRDVLVDAPDESDRIEFEFQLAGPNAGYSFFVPYFGLQRLGMKQGKKRVFKVEVFFDRPALVAYFQSFIERLSPEALSVAERIMQSIHRHQRKRGNSSINSGVMTELTFEQLL
jgi:hypothetical protein